MTTSCFNKAFPALLLSILLTIFVSFGQVQAEGTQVIIDDWSVGNLYSRPNPSCCTNPLGCPLTTSGLTSIPYLQVAYNGEESCQAKPSGQAGFAWSVGKPCNIIGSYRDIGLTADRPACLNNTAGKAIFA